MADTIEVRALPTGLALTLSLYPAGSDVATETGLVMAEAVNRKGVYTTSPLTAPVGWFLVVALLGANVLAQYDVLLNDDDTVRIAHDRDQESSVGVGQVLAAIAALNDLSAADVEAVVAAMEAQVQFLKDVQQGSKDYVTEGGVKKFRVRKASDDSLLLKHAAYQVDGAGTPVFGSAPAVSGPDEVGA